MMRATLIVLLAAGSLAVADGPTAAAPPQPSDPLIGVWVLVTIETDTITISGEQLSKFRMAFTGSAFLLVMDQTVTGTYTVDTGRTPHALDMSPFDGPGKGKTIRRIYEINGDMLRVCQGSGEDRPPAFPAKLAPGQAIEVWKRVKK